ncbi:CRISPR-associated endonuclease Cas3'' [Natronomonas gomsonensis]|uniref:CRISPR-associated endonuclease Cas3'' n=1 Tax=Natronomonas gomsonensis TaxID=1046043 RepID=UPI0015B9AA75|nr:CRISPR-associated endonuclease Cas3'' [Natronomonas gomsonensis]
MANQPLESYDARPGQSLAEHIEGVAAGAEALTTDAGMNPYGDDWSGVLQTLAWTHDIGKLTGYFQTYLKTGDRQSAPRPELTYHGTFGALVTSLAMVRTGYAPETAAAGFYAVAKHHSVIQNIPTDIRRYHLDKEAVDARFELAEQQLSNIDATGSPAADEALRQATNGAYSWDELLTDGLSRARATIKQMGERIPDETFYGCVLRMWSTLVTADKFDASGITTRDDVTGATEISRPAPNRLTSEVRKIAETKLSDGEPASAYLDTPDRPLPAQSASIKQRLDGLRTAANARTTENVLNEFSAGNRVFELTLPTGFGKTYTGLRAGLSLADHRNSRLIYALPYTSIIDQVGSNIEDVFDISETDPAFTKHHHLADTRTVQHEGDDFADSASSGRETLHAEAWRSGLILTTFTQLLESVAGPGNVQSMKLPALQDSVIILDEPQAIPLQWWELVGRLTRYLVSEYDATVLFMTATQPRILNQMDHVPSPTPVGGLHEDCIDLIDDYPRVSFRLHESLQRHIESPGGRPYSLASAADELLEATTSPMNTAAIVNTVDSATTLATQLDTREDVVFLGSELLSYHQASEGDSFDACTYLEYLAETVDEDALLVATLTTRLRPVDRVCLIESLRAILDGKIETPFDTSRTITVTTQLLEAGVDISFDRLYRDLAPLPAIVQAAGRCNRSFSADPSEVVIWRLDSQPSETFVPSQLIYGDHSLLRPTLTALEALRTKHGAEELPEGAVISTGISEYYDALHDQRQTGQRQDRLTAAFDTAKGKLLREASLIEETQSSKEVLVLVTEEDTTHYDEYVAAKAADEWETARQKFNQLKECLVTVSDESQSDEDKLDAVRPDEIHEKYDIETGSGVQL